MQSFEPKVSIILPTFNRAHYLPDTIQSILDQSYSDFELIVVDDGSTDHTEQIIRDLRTHSFHIKYIKLPENRGIGFARDQGLQHARGEYVAWIDSDDPWLPGKLEEQVRIMDSYTDIDILFGDYLNFDHIQNKQTTLFHNCRHLLEALPKQQLEEGVYLVEKDLERVLLIQNLVSTPTAIIRLQLLQRTGSFDIALRSGEDVEFFFRAALWGARYAYLDKAVMERHKTKTSITAEHAKSWMETIYALDRCELWCHRNARDDLLPSLRNARQRAVRNVLSEYGRNRQRVDVMRLFRRGFHDGFSFRSFVYMLAALAGPHALNFIDKWQRRT